LLTIDHFTGATRKRAPFSEHLVAKSWGHRNVRRTWLVSRWADTTMQNRL
jgi:hypothetical protein